MSRMALCFVELETFGTVHSFSSTRSVAVEYSKDVNEIMASMA